uniref:Amyloid beta protein binding family B member 3 n=1 Tax=Chelonoidis abingdonii TaxID=106734 RepID=A0A8C0J202_CHEAB
MLKCHVFHCNVPAKAIAKALHEMCSKVCSWGHATQHAWAWPSLAPSALLSWWQGESGDTLKTNIYLGCGPSPLLISPGMDILNEAIETLMSSQSREQWTPSLVSVLDSVMTVHQAEEDAHIFECQVRYVTFIGVGKDVHTFAFIVDMGQQHFQCTAFWCEPDAGTISEAVQAACMVSVLHPVPGELSAVKCAGLRALETDTFHLAPERGCMGSSPSALPYRGESMIQSVSALY